MKRRGIDLQKDLPDLAQLPSKKPRNASAKQWLRGIVDSRRVRCLTPKVIDPKPGGKVIICLLQRDLRLQDNWALLFAQVRRSLLTTLFCPVAAELSPIVAVRVCHTAGRCVVLKDSPTFGAPGCPQAHLPTYVAAPLFPFEGD